MFPWRCLVVESIVKASWEQDERNVSMLEVGNSRMKWAMMMDSIDAPNAQHIDEISIFGDVNDMWHFVEVTN